MATKDSPLRLTVTGYARLYKKLAADEMLRVPLATALDELGSFALAVMKQRAPRGKSGDLMKSLGKTNVSKAPGVPRYIKVGSYPIPTAKGAKGKPFRYPGALEGAKDRYHYRNGLYPIPGRKVSIGRFSVKTKGLNVSSGQSTKGWMSGTLPLIKANVSKTLRAAAQAIKIQWESGQE